MATTARFIGVYIVVLGATFLVSLAFPADFDATPLFFVTSALFLVYLGVSLYRKKDSRR